MLHQSVDVAVVDSNVFLKDPYALYAIDARQLVIPFHVLEELDHLCNSSGNQGRHARQAVRIIESLRLKGNLHDGVPLKDDLDKSRFLVTPLSFFRRYNSNHRPSNLENSNHICQTRQKDRSILAKY